MNILDKIRGKQEKPNLENEISRAEEDISRIEGQIALEKNKYNDEENNSELIRLRKQIQGAQDRLNFLKEKRRREEEKQVEQLKQ